MNPVLDHVIRRTERQMDARLDELRSLADASPAALLKMAFFRPLSLHRRRAPRAAWHLARIAADREQDCGTCLQIAVTAARRDGVPAATLRAALDGDADALTADERLALDYGRAVAARAPDVDALVAQVRDRWGETVLTELALAVATVQVFPVLKRGLGQATACALVQIEVDERGAATG